MNDEQAQDEPITEMVGEAPMPTEFAEAEFERLINELENLLTSANRVPFSRRLMLDEELVLDIIDRMRVAVPEELRQARQIVRERDQLLETARKALRRYKLRRLAIVGGVACNRGLRSAAAERFKGVELTFPPASLCTDNAAMIGALAVALGDRAPRVTLDMNVDANLKMHESGD